MKKIIPILIFFLLSFNLTFGNINPCSPNDSTWVKTFNGTGNGIDIAVKVAADDCGNVYVTGYTLGGGINFDYVTIKYNPDGVVQWNKKYNGTGNGSDIASDLKVDNNGNVYVTGYSGSASNNDYLTIKYDPDGNVLWTKRYNGVANSDDKANALALDDSGNVYVTGASTSSGGYDVVTIKYSPDSTVLWTQVFNGPANSQDYGSEIVVDDSGNVCVCGYSTGSTSGTDYVVIKYNSTGVFKWNKVYNGTGNSTDWATDICVDFQRNIYVTGFSTGNGSGIDYATIKYNSGGTLQWTQRYNGTGNADDYAEDILVDNSGNVYVTGGSSADITGNFALDYVTLKYDSTGTIQWTKRYNGTGNSVDYALGIAKDNSQNIYVTGYSRIAGTGTAFENIVTLKYNSSGNLLKNLSYNGVANNQDEGNAIVADNFGNVYVAGYASTPTKDLVVIKYSAKDFAMKLQLTLFLEGFYDVSSNTQTGDTIKVLLRNSVSPYAAADSSSALISNSGNCSINFLNSADNNYYIEVKHRNSIRTWSSNTLSLTHSSAVSYDFSNALNKAYGNNQKQVDTSPLRYAFFSGDENQDGNVDVTDIIDIYNEQGSSGYIPADVNGDYFIDVSDLLIAYNNSLGIVGVITP